MFGRVILTVAALGATTVVVADRASADDTPFASAATTNEMIVTANPLATAAGARVLQTGGTAADAMVAAQTVLGLVEPQSSGLGGGAFVVYYDAATGTTTTIDAREKAPAAATEDRFAGLGFFPAWQSGLSVGVPGVPRLLEYMHANYGARPWRTLFVPAKTLAQDGFALSQRTSDQVAGLLALNPSCDSRVFFRDPTALAYFADPVTCVAKPAGSIVTNRAYADVMRALADGGADAFYEGEIASAISHAVQTDPAIPGDMTTADLAAYDVVERPPVCLEYRGHDVCGMGPPSSGGLAVGQILGILENFDLAGIAGSDGPLDEQVVHLFTQAGRLAFADRGLYVGDSDFVTVPSEGMLDAGYLATRAALITDTDMGIAAPGTPPGEFDPTAPDLTTRTSGTSHISIVDRWGNALSMTTSIESPFGNGVMVHGFLLNNELTDFSFSPVGSDGTPVANRVQPNKRPRSSMSPTIVFDPSGEVELVTGSPGGSRIIGYTAQSIINHIDFGLDPQLSVAIPHVQNRNGSTEVEDPIPGVTIDFDAAALRSALAARGHPVSGNGTLTSGLSIIEIIPGALLGGADLRRDGTVGGR